MDKEILLQKCLERAVEEEEIAGGCILVNREGQEICYLESGLANREERRPISRNTIYHLFSMSKPITAAAVMILLEEGVIDLYEPVSRYVPSFGRQSVMEGDEIVPVQKQMIIKDLLSMTSGLTYPGQLNRAELETGNVYAKLEEEMKSGGVFTTKRFADEIGGCVLAFQPGESWQYGVSADILGAVVEAASGIRFGEFLEKRLFGPLGMEDTGFFLPYEKRERLATVYESVQEQKLKPYEQDHLGIRISACPNPFESGGAGLLSTADDYFRFADMLLNGGKNGDIRILEEETVRFFTGCGLDSKRQESFSQWFGLDGHTYGNLMRILTDRKLAGILGSAGEYGWDGWLGTYFVNDPVRKITLIFMTQKKDFGTSNLTRKIKNIVFS